MAGGANGPCLPRVHALVGSEHNQDIATVTTLHRLTEEHGAVETREISAHAI